MDIYTVTKPNTVADPSYSPDGSLIIFVEKIGSTYKISTIDQVATQTHTVLQSGSQRYADPYYSPNGQLIVFAVQTGAVSGPNPYGQWALKYMFSDGTGLSTILDDGNSNIHPCWVTPTQIAFQYWTNGVSTEFEIALIDVAGQGRVNVGPGEYPRGVTM